MHTTRRALKNLDALVMLGAMPVTVLALAGVGLGIGALSTIDGRAWALAHELHAGNLDPESITEFAGWARTSLLVTTGLTFAMVPLTIGVLWLGLRGIHARLTQLTDFVEARARGESPELLDSRTTCALGTLETALMALSTTLESRDVAFDKEVRSNRFEGELQRALELVDVEHDVMDVTVRALDLSLPGRSVELLLADSSQAHLRRATATDSMGTPEHGGCRVSAPHDCAAVRRGRTLRFASSESLDACPKLRNRASGPCSGVCSPVTVMGRTIGVLHLQGPQGELLEEERVRQFRSVATNVGTRLGVIRTLADTQRAARTDPLTGLMNRRTFETEAVRAMSNVGHGLLVMADMDHFKNLNDTHGHQAGDRALCLFSRVLKQHLEAPNVVARYGGEEFILMLPGLGVEEGVALLQSARTALAEALSGSSVPSFTCSMGVAQFPIDGDELERLTELADAALYQAKENGRNRVEVAGRVAHSHLTDALAAR